jgi:AraC-like DNA-binding protein
MCETVCLDYAIAGAGDVVFRLHAEGLLHPDFCDGMSAKGPVFQFCRRTHRWLHGFFPAGGVLDAFTPEGYANASVTVPSEVFLAAVEQSFPEIPESVLVRGAGMRIGMAEQARLRGLLGAVLEAVEDPSAPLMGGTARGQLEIDLLDAFLSALRSGCDSLVPRPGLRVEGRLRRLRQARDYLKNHLHESLSVAALCPAYAWGFWHMGHFAREYSDLFGESPSMTLSRQANRR